MNVTSGIAATQADRPANGEADSEWLSPEAAMHVALKRAKMTGVEIRPGALRVLIRRLTNGRNGANGGRIERSTLNEMLTRLLTYNDPTGETAVRNVLREAKSNI